MWPRQIPYMYGKSFKKKIKKCYEKSVNLSLWPRSVGIYDFRVDTFCKKKVSCDRLFCHLRANCDISIQESSLARLRFIFLVKMIFFTYIYRNDNWECRSASNKYDDR